MVFSFVANQMCRSHYRIKFVTQDLENDRISLWLSRRCCSCWSKYLQHNGSGRTMRGLEHRPVFLINAGCVLNSGIRTFGSDGHSIGYSCLNRWSLKIVFHKRSNRFLAILAYAAAIVRLVYASRSGAINESGLLLAACKSGRP